MDDRQTLLIEALREAAIRLFWESSFEGKAYGSRHLHRVQKIAEYLRQREGGDEFLVSAGASFGKRRSRIGVLAQNIESETGVPFVTPGDPTLDRRQRGESTLIAVPFSWHIAERWSLELIGSQIDTIFEFTDPEDAWVAESTTETTSTQARLASHHHLGGHTLSWGGEWRSDEVTDSSNFGANLDEVSTDVTSAFLQDAWQAGSKLRLILGARWDDTEQWGDELSPRVNLGWKMSNTLELRVGYGEAFRPPTLGELFFPLSGNPDLVPETSSCTTIVASPPPARPIRGRPSWAPARAGSAATSRR